MWLKTPLAALYSCVLVAAVALVGCEPPPADSEEIDSEAAASAVVSYALEVSIPSPATASSPLLASLAQDPNLGRLSMSTATAPGDRALQEMEAEFVFGTVDAFFEWRERPETEALLESLRTMAPDTVALSPRLSIRRPSLYRSVVGRVTAEEGSGGRAVESVACNEDCSRIDVAYTTRRNEAGGAGAGQGTGDAGDIDAVTLVCKPGLAGTIESCKVSN